MGDLSGILQQESKTVQRIYEHYKKQGDAGRQFSRRLGASQLGKDCDREL